MVTLTRTVQLALAAKVAPLRASDVSPAFGVKVPPHELLTLGLDATVIPDGKRSVKPTPVRPVPFGLLMMTVRVKASPAVNGPGGKLAVIDGGTTAPQAAERGRTKHTTPRSNRRYMAPPECF